ncbi:MAG: hypothetical protein AMXMBFR53_13870 [Gemmatimonadota bacterium]
MRSSLVLLLALTTLTGSGCYKYIPSSAMEVAPGQTVRVRLSAAEAARYQDLRLADSRLLDGTVVDRTGGDLVVEATVGANDPTRGTRALVQQVSVPLAGVLGVDLKELDKVKTGLLVGGGGAVLLAVILKAGDALGGEDPGGNDVPEARRVPLFRFALPLGRP